MSAMLPDAEALLPAFLDLSLSGVICYTALPAPADAAPDFAVAYLNPAARQLLPRAMTQATVASKQFPEASYPGLQAFFRSAYASAQPLYFELSASMAPGTMGLRLAARCLQNYLLVSLTEVTPPVPNRLETALQQAAWQPRPEAAPPQLLHSILGQVPASIATLTGPEHRHTFFNHSYQQLSGGRTRLGSTLAEVFQELPEQGFVEQLHQVYATGRVLQGRETLVALFNPATHQTEPRYLDFTFQPLLDDLGRMHGILALLVDVTEKVLARQQAELLQAELLAKAQRQVQERDELFQVFEQTPAMVAILRGPEHQLYYHNPAFRALFPHRPFIGLLHAESIPEMAEAGLLPVLNQVYTTGQPHFSYAQPLHTAPPGGGPAQLRYFNFTYQAYHEDDRVVGVSIFAYDVTEQVLDRQARDAQAQRFRDLYEQAPMAVTILRGPEFIVELANPAILRIWGLTAEEALGKPRLSLMPETSRAALRATLEMAYHTRQPYSVQEFPVVLDRPHSGQPALGYFNFIYQPLLDADNNPLALTCVGIEVTQQVLSRQASQAIAHRLQLLTNHLPVLIGYLGRDQCYQFANEAYRTWLNQDPATLLGQSVRVVKGEAAYAQAQPYLERALTGERVSFEAFMPYERAPARHVHSDYVPDIQGGEVVGIFTLVNDISAQMQARQEVQQLNEQLATTNEELRHANQELHTTNRVLTRTNADLDTFVYAASHDLKAPIANLEGLLEALQEYLPSPQPEPMIGELVGRMQQAVERFQLTMGHLSDIARLPQEADNEPILLVDILGSVLPDLADLLVDVELVLEVDCCPALIISPHNLRSILFNLLSNALKYHDPARPNRVRLQAYSTAEHVVLEVEDQGLGLTEKQQAHLFTMFRRLHHHVEGSGVGLYMVKRIVENAGGAIQVRSQPGVGSCFTVLLPLPVQV